MKKTLSIILAIVMMLSVMPMAFAAEETPPTTEIDGETYYQLDSADDLYWFAEQVNGGSVEINAILTDDIVVNENLLTEKLTLTESTVNSGLVCVATINEGQEVREWTPIGTEMYNNEYSGHFNGNGKTISGLYFDDQFDYSGLFGVVGNATIENLTLKDSYLQCYRNFGGGFVGVTNGDTSSTLSYLINEATVSARNAGGIVGYNQGGCNISNCINAGSIYITSYNGGNSIMYKPKLYSGGILGYSSNDYTITNSINVGKALYFANITKDLLENCYYLDTASNGVSIETEGVISATAEQFATGEVAYLINGDQSNIIFKQILGVDDYPNFVGEQVYKVYNCKNETAYNNTTENIGHIGGEPITENETAPTCTVVGSYDTVVYCTVCGEVASRVTTTVPATGHLGETEIRGAFEATESDDGYTGDTYCLDCGDKIADGEIIPQLGCTDCDRVHKTFIDEFICVIISFFNLIKSMF